MSLAQARAGVHVKHPVARAVFSANKGDINFVGQATVAAFEAIKASAVTMEAHPLAGAVRQKAVDCTVERSSGSGPQEGRHRKKKKKKKRDKKEKKPKIRKNRYWTSNKHKAKNGGGKMQADTE